MKVTLGQIREMAHGCVRVVEEDGAWRFNRLPEALAEHYREAEGSRVRMECTSGVRLRFRTDATGLQLGLRYGAAARPYYQCGVCVDGREPLAFGPLAAMEAWEGELVLNGELVDLWLPHLVKTMVTSLELVGATRLEPAPAQPKWLVLGDSITQGMTVPLPTQMTVSLVARELGLDPLSLGIGGAKLEGWLAEDELDWPYDLLTVAYGTNDFNQGIEVASFAANARTLLRRQRAAHPEAALVVITPLPWAGRTDANRIGVPFEAYREALAEVVAEFPGVTLLHGPELVPDDAGMFVDNVHPNEHGMATYARNLVAALKGVVGK